MYNFDILQITRFRLKQIKYHINGSILANGLLLESVRSKVLNPSFHILFTRIYFDHLQPVLSQHVEIVRPYQLLTAPSLYPTGIQIIHAMANL